MSRRNKAPRFEYGDEVEVMHDQYDREGRVMARAGARGLVRDLLKAPPAHVVVDFVGSHRHWPVLLSEIRAARAPRRGELDAQRLAGVFEAARRLLQYPELPEKLAEAGHLVLGIRKYVMRLEDSCDFLDKMEAYEMLCDGCASTGVCGVCRGESTLCTACGGLRICAVCAPGGCERPPEADPAT